MSQLKFFMRTSFFELNIFALRTSRTKGLKNERNIAWPALAYEIRGVLNIVIMLIESVQIPSCTFGKIGVVCTKALEIE